MSFVFFGTMIKNYIKLAVRNLAKVREFTLLNIAGLSCGLACCLFLSLWVFDELNVDQFHEKKANLYQIYSDVQVGGAQQILPYIPSALSAFIEQEIPEIKSVSRVFPGTIAIRRDNLLTEENGLYADPSFLSQFSFDLVEGNQTSLLQQPNEVVVSQDLAQKLFGNEQAVGKVIQITQNEAAPYTITGVFNIPNVESSLHFDFILSYEYFEKEFRPWWGKDNPASFTNFNVTGYIELNSNARIAEVNRKLSGLLKTYGNSESQLFIYPFHKVYLHSDFSNGRVPTGKIQYVWLVGSIALIVLIIACVNFVNLSTLLAIRRKSEAGMRKVLGASQRQIVSQMLTEAIIVTVLALILAVTIVQLSLPFFNRIVDKQIQIPFDNPVAMLMLLLFALMLGIISGAYPALFFSSFNILNEKKSSNMDHNFGLKQGMVVFQFSCAIFLIIATLIVHAQIDFIRNKDLGIQTQNVIGHPLHGIRENTDSYEKALLQIPGIQSVSFTEQDPISTSNRNQGVSWPGRPEENPPYFNVIQTNESYLETFDIELIQGESFKTFTEGKIQFIINELAAQQIGSEDIIGLPMKVWGNDGEVVGVIKNYHHQSLDAKIEPLIIICNPKQTWNAFIHFSANGKPPIDQIKETYTRFESNYPFDYFFLDDKLSKTYQSITETSQLSSVFSMVAIFISCLGLFGLSAFVMFQKKKEASIKKVLGAGERKLLVDYTTNFLKPVFLSMFISIPLAWFFQRYWLSNFAYRVEPGLWPYIVAMGFSITIAVVTVVFNTNRTVKANPVNVLKES